MGGITSIKILLASKIEAMRFYNGRTQITTSPNSYPQEVFFSYKSASVSCEPVRNSDVFNINISWQVPKYRPDLLDSIFEYFNKKCVIEITFSNKEVKIFGSPDNPMIINFNPTRQSAPEDYNGAIISANCIDFAPGRFKTSLTAIVEPVCGVPYLPSNYETSYMWDVLHNDPEPLGNFSTEIYYWTSTQGGGTGEDEYATYRIFGESQSGGLQVKYANFLVRPVIKHIYNNATAFNLREIGPTGGWIFYIQDNGNGSWSYHEAMPTDTAEAAPWSNIDDVAVDMPENQSQVDSGYENSIAIVNQEGHTHSAAQDALNYQPPS